MFPVRRASGLLILALAPAARPSDLDARLESVRKLLHEGHYKEAHASGRDVAESAARAKDDRALGRACILVGDSLYYQGQREEMMRAL